LKTHILKVTIGLESQTHQNTFPLTPIKMAITPRVNYYNSAMLSKYPCSHFIVGETEDQEYDQLSNTMNRKFSNQKC
jgi:hypothetical protein